MLRVVQARPLAWRQDLASRLVHQAPLTGRLAVVLAGETGIEPPATLDFALAWYWRAVRTSRKSSRSSRPPLVDVLRNDPLLQAVPRLPFEPDDIGFYIKDSESVRRGWPGALATLAAEGRLDRAVLLDGCLGRLLRGGKVDNLIAYRQIYQALQTTVDEVAGRVRNLVALLPDAPTTVASLAQADLRRLDEAGRLATGTLAETSRAALARPEKKLVASQLSWLNAAIRRQPERAAELPSTVTVAFGHARPEIQQKAVALLARHRQQLDSGAREQVAAAADNLPPDLQSQLTAALDPEKRGEPG